LTDLSIRVVIAETFQSATGGVGSLEVEGKTVSQCLGQAAQALPGLQKLWFKSENRLADHILVLVNGENTSQNNFSRSVQDGDEIFPMVIIGGG
jgi:molybdopterin converting factor small subunit